MIPTQTLLTSADRRYAIKEARVETDPLGWSYEHVSRVTLVLDFSAHNVGKRVHGGVGGLLWLATS